MSLPRTRAVWPLGVAALVVVLIGVSAGVAPSASAVAAAPAADAAAAGPYDPVAHTTTIPVACSWATPVGTGDPRTWVTSVTMRATYPDRVRFGGRFDITDIGGSFTFGGPVVGNGVGAQGSLIQVDRDTAPEGILVDWMQGSTAIFPATQVDLGVQPKSNVDARGYPGQAMDFRLGHLDVGTFRYGSANGPIPFPTTAVAAVSCVPAPGAPGIAHIVIDPPETGGFANDHVAFVVTGADGRVLHSGAGFMEGVGNDVDYWYGREGLISTVTGRGTFHAADGSKMGFSIDTSAATTPTGFWTPIAPPTQLLLLDEHLGQIILVTHDPTKPANGLFLIGGTEGGNYPERTISAGGAARGTAYPSGEAVTVYWGIRNLR